MQPLCGRSRLSPERAHGCTTYLLFRFAADLLLFPVCQSRKTPDPQLGLANHHYPCKEPGVGPGIRLKQTVFKTPFFGVPFDFSAPLNWRLDGLLENIALSATR